MSNWPSRWSHCCGEGDEPHTLLAWAAAASLTRSRWLAIPRLDVARRCHSKRAAMGDAGSDQWPHFFLAESGSAIPESLITTSG